MDYRFLTDAVTRKPALFRAILEFNRSCEPSMPEELLSLGAPFPKLWEQQSFRRAWPTLAQEHTGYWNFSEESQRLALLDIPSLERLGLIFSAAVHAEDLALILSREQVLSLRHTLGDDIYAYALTRGRYQIGSLRSLLLIPPSLGTTAERIKMLSKAIPSLIMQGWPEQLCTMAKKKFSCGEDPVVQGEPLFKVFSQEERRSLWFTMKKILLREVAPKWAPCFD